MFSFGTSFFNSPQGLLSSITTPGMDVMSASSSAIFAAPLTIDLKLICTFCENSFEFTNGASKTREMKQLESIALEHFKRRVLKIEEESLVAASMVFPDDVDGSRYKKLLSSITLCNSCVSHFVKNEQDVLKDQLKYIEKFSGVRKMEDVFNDPWLDIKRLAFHSIKCQEPVIKEKLELMEKLSSGEGTMTACVSSGSSSFVSVQSTDFTSTPNQPSTSTTAQQVLLATLNFPIVSESGGTPTSMEVQDHQFESIAAAVTAPSGDPSLPSSSVGSPKQDKDIESSNDNESVNSKNDDTITDGNPPQRKAIPVKTTSVKVGQEKTNETDDEGNVSEAESGRILRNTIPPKHQSPVVRLKPISVTKTPPPSTSKLDDKGESNESKSAAKAKVAKKLNMDEVASLLEKDESSSQSSASNALVIDEDDVEVNDNVGGSDNEGESSQQVNGENGDSQGEQVIDEGKENDNIDDPNSKSDEEEMIRKNGENQDGNTGTPAAAPKVNKTNLKKATCSQEEVNEPQDESDADENSVPMSEDISENDESFPKPISSTGKGKKRKRRSSDGKKLTVKFDFPKQAKLSQENELQLTASSNKKEALSTPTGAGATNHRKDTPAPKRIQASKKSKKKSKLDTETSVTPIEKGNKRDDDSSSLVTPKKHKKKSNSSDDSAFATPTALSPTKKTGGMAASSKNVMGSGSVTGGKTKLGDFIREALGKKASSRTSSSAKEPSAPEEPEKKTKKYFRIGNRYMTEESSSSDDSDDDPSFVGPATLARVVHSESD